MATFGLTSESGASVFTLSPNVMRMCKFTLSEAGSVSKLTAYMKNDESADQVVRCIIYAADGNSGKPGTLKGLTNEVNIPFITSAGWIDFAFATAVNLTAADYYLGVFPGGSTGSAKLYYVSGGTYYYDEATYPTAPSTCPSPSSGGSYSFCIYATYTVAATAKPHYYYAQL